MSEGEDSLRPQENVTATSTSAALAPDADPPQVVKPAAKPAAAVADNDRGIARKRKKTLQDLRVQFGSSLGWSYLVFVLLIPLLVGFLIAVLAGIIPGAQTIDKLALATSLQVGLGIYLGFMSLYFGVMMTWLGIESAFNLSAQGKGSGKEAQVTFTSASPGLLLSLMGGVLVVACLYKTIEFKMKDNTNKPAGEVIQEDNPKRVGAEDGVYTPPRPAKAGDESKQSEKGKH